MASWPRSRRPVCVASYTAAGIADANAMKTGLKGFTYAMVGFLVPFVFVYNPPILLEGTLVEIVIGHGAAGPGHLFPGRDGGGLLQVQHEQV